MPQLNLYSRLSLRGIGPGGPKCSCCAPPRGRKTRQQRHKKVRQMLKHAARRTVDNLEAI